MVATSSGLISPTTVCSNGTEETGAVSIFRSQTDYANGNTRDRQGRLITCVHGARSIVRTEYDGTITTLIDSYQGKRLNSPNDVVVKSDGSIRFTDPPFGLLSNYEGHRQFGSARMFIASIRKQAKLRSLPTISWGPTDWPSLLMSASSTSSKAEASRIARYLPSMSLRMAAPFRTSEP